MWNVELNVCGHNCETPQRRQLPAELSPEVLEVLEHSSFPAACFPPSLPRARMGVRTASPTYRRASLQLVRRASPSACAGAQRRHRRRRNGGVAAAATATALCTFVNRTRAAWALSSQNDRVDRRIEETQPRTCRVVSDCCWSTRTSSRYSCSHCSICSKGKLASRRSTTSQYLKRAG
jgi:hypothetical protein